jgi:RNA 3'-terminal phosphate cyclase-like protein
MYGRHAVRVSPQFSNRMIESSRSILNRYIPDIYIHSDVYKGEEGGKYVPTLPTLLAPHVGSRSPGYGLSLVAESTTSVLLCSEALSKPGASPEDTATKATLTLLREISMGGCVDRMHQGLVLLMMVLGSQDVGRCRMGEPTART